MTSEVNTEEKRTKHARTTNGTPLGAESLKFSIGSGKVVEVECSANESVLRLPLQQDL